MIGAKDYDKIDNIALHGLLIIVISSILSLVVFELFSNQILHLFAPESELSLISIYMCCIVIFLLFIFLSEYMVELLNGEGDTRLSTAIMSLGVVLNIVLDYIFIFPCGMGIFGGSLGTSLAYVITTFIFLYVYLVRKDHLVKFTLSDFSFDWAIIREILVNAVPIILDSLIIGLLFSKCR